MDTSPIGEPPPPGQGPEQEEGPSYAQQPSKRFEEPKVKKKAKREDKAGEKKISKEEAAALKKRALEEEGLLGQKRAAGPLRDTRIGEKKEFRIEPKEGREEQDKKGKALKDEEEEEQALRAVLPGPAQQPLVAGKSRKKGMELAGPATRQGPALAQVATPVIVASQIDTSSMKPGVVSNVDKIVEVFQNNRFFGAALQQIQVSQRGVETVVSVSLQNGVEVQVNLAPGGQELNIVIQGLTATAQAEIDNRENQQLLMERLAERGFIVHQIQTFRAEGGAPAAPVAALAPPTAPITAPTAGETLRERGEREGRGEGGEEGGEGGEGEGRR